MAECSVVKRKMNIKLAWGDGCDEKTAIYECYQSIGRDVKSKLTLAEEWPLCKGDCPPEVIEGRSYECGCYLIITLTQKVEVVEVREDYALGAGCPEGSHPKGAEYKGDVLLTCRCLPKYAYGDVGGVLIPIAEKPAGQK